MRNEVRPNRFKSFALPIKHKVSDLKKLENKYSYIDVETLLYEEEEQEKRYTRSMYRVLWMDSCRYKFGVHIIGRKRKSIRNRRLIKRDFDCLMKGIRIRREEEMG
jgi:hypothetical protein